MINVEKLEREDQILPIGKDYIPDGENLLRKSVFLTFSGSTSPEDYGDRELLSEAVFWSLGELINNANKANNRWALLRNALFQRASKANPEEIPDKLYRDIDYAIEHSQSDLLVKYNLKNLDLTDAILKLIQMHDTNSFALSERFNKKIDLTLRIRQRPNEKVLSINVINNSPMTVVDRKRVEYNLQKVKEDILNAGQDPFEAALHLYDKLEDTAGGGFGAGLRSIILFLKEAYAPFPLSITYSRLINYRTTPTSTIFSIELPIPD